MFKIKFLYKLKVLLFDTSHVAIQAAEDQTVKTTVEADYAALKDFLDWSRASVASISETDFNDIS